MGISIGLTNSQIEEAMKAGATRDPAIIAKLTPEQIEYLDAQIKSGAGMAGLILGNITWGDRLDKTVAVDPNDIPKLEGLPIPNEPGGTALVNPVPERDKNDGIYITPEQKQDKDAGILPGAEINTGNWRDNILTSNDVESSWHQGSFDSSRNSLQKHFEKDGKEVGASDAEQYLRKAEGFAKQLRVARKVTIAGATENVTRYYKNGKYIDIASDNRIISFGKQ
ncbi:hypothetical protein [Phytobacter ursingii]|uniref:Filamentous hemagglutinin n=1 Tax=Phytobacter ursingii TaxID=1972431 RepID=A0AB35RIM4_9ENTR|nr:MULTISPECIES: hypothetical protein [Enterobacteriaceae]MDV2861886.1 hypothetical protein [Phytobacter ursingii]